MTTQNKNVPALRFPEFNGEWQEKRLREIGKFNSGTGFPENAQGGKSGVPFYKVSDMNLDGNEFEMSVANNYVTEEQIKKLKYKPIKEHSIIFAKVGAAIFLERKRIAKDFLIDNNMMSFTPNGNILFLKYLFETLRLSKYAQVGALPSYNSSDIGIIKINIPSTTEQQKIAAFLTAVDEKIQQLAKKKDLLEQYKKGVMQKIFNQEIRFKDDNGNDFADWEEKKGNEVFDSISNKNHNSDLPILAITQEYGAIPRDLIDYQISVTDKSVESYKVVEVGDFIISLRSFQGGIEYSNYKGICSPAYIILRSKVAINDLFFKYYLKTDFYIQQLNSKLEGIRDGKMVSYKYFSEISLPFPSIEEQNKIAAFLSAIDDKINLAGRQLEKTKEYKKGLLQQMFV